MFEYFAANYFLNNGYTMTTAAGFERPDRRHDEDHRRMAVRQPEAGWWFMMIQALTVFLALIGTTLSCINTGARVTYAMGRDDEVPSHFGMLHGKNLTPHRAIWTLAAISAVIGIFAVLLVSVRSGCYRRDWSASDRRSEEHSIWYPNVADLPTSTHAESIANSLLVVTLVSNFGTFLLYMLTCIVAIVAFREHHTFNTIQAHGRIPVFGLLANLAACCSISSGRSAVAGMSKKEPYIALGVVALWGLYGWFYFTQSQQEEGQDGLLHSRSIRPLGVADRLI